MKTEKRYPQDEICPKCKKPTITYWQDYVGEFYVGGHFEYTCDCYKELRQLSSQK